MSVTLGDKVKDKITGFTGIATGRCTYLTGCTQICITPPVGKDGKIQDSAWMDEDRLTVTKKAAVALDIKNDGPMQSPPSY